MMGNLLFKVIRPSDGHEFLIYDNGAVEGFEPNSIIVNYYPALVRAECLRLIAGQQGEQQSLEQAGNT